MSFVHCRGVRHCSRTIQTFNFLHIDGKGDFIVVINDVELRSHSYHEARIMRKK